MTTNNMKSDKMTFWQLLKDHKVEIPIIQRDYAQGRKNDDKTERIRNLFLDKLTKAIKGEEKPIELDFVYGDLKENDVFQPLDGQQRLTTLFLLHWYIAFKAGKLPEVKETLSKFTYETRASSREFCQSLVKERLPNDAAGENIRAQIEDASWFFLSWNNDPTIEGMLVMLDAIEEKLKGESIDEALWERLTSEKNPPISFYFTELRKFGLSDDLYIKMNARGKELTDFENFKARFEEHIKEGGFEESVKYENKFSTKIDGVWLDLFWKYKADNTVDNEFMNFMAGVARNYYAAHLEISDESKNKIKSLFDNPKALEPRDFSTEDAFNYLKDCFNVYAKKKEDNFCNIEKDKELNLFFNGIKKDETTLFEYGIKNKPGYNQQFLCYAQTSFLLKVNDENEFNQEHFDDWMRVHRNIAMNCGQDSIDSVVRYMGAVKLSNELSKGWDNIYAFLADDKNTIKSNFAGNQVAEERIKAGLIIKDKTNWRQEIIKIDDHDYFAGQIGFILGYAKNEAGHDIDKFKSYADKLAILFGDDFGNENRALFRRALLTKGDYLPPRGKNWSKRQLSFSFEKSLGVKVENWRRVFNDKERAKILKELLDDDKLKNSSDMAQSLKEIIENYIENNNDWRKVIVNPKLDWIFFRHSVLFENGRIYVLNKDRTSSYHFELFTYYFYIKLCEHHINKEGIEVGKDRYWVKGAKHLNSEGKGPHVPICNKIQNKNYEICHEGNQVFLIHIWDGNWNYLDGIKSEGVQQTIAKLKAIFSDETPQT